MAAVDIRNPLARILSIIQIQHGSHGIHADSIRVILIRPEQSVGNQEIGNSRTAVIIDQSPPMGMGALSWIFMLIYACPVKISQPKAVSREVGRNPVENHADPLSVHIIHEIHKIIRRTVPAGGCIIPGNLIAPGSVQRMLHNRKQLHMGISHHLYILCQFYRNLTVVIKLGTNDIIPVLIPLCLFPDPRSEMNLIDGHGLIFRIRLRTLFHPRAILPLVTVRIPYDRSRVRTQLTEITVRIRF